MGTVHDLLHAVGKKAAIEAGLDRNVVEAASLYMGDEDGSLNFVYLRLGTVRPSTQTLRGRSTLGNCC